MTSPDPDIQLFKMSLCGFCQRYRDDKPGTCDAYVDGIPEILLSGEVQHIKPYEGDRGLMFLEMVRNKAPSDKQDPTPFEEVQHAVDGAVQTKKKAGRDPARASGSD